jgi:hypothetical protein
LAARGAVAASRAGRAESHPVSQLGGDERALDDLLRLIAASLPADPVKFMDEFNLLMAELAADQPGDQVYAKRLGNRLALAVYCCSALLDVCVRLSDELGEYWDSSEALRVMEREIRRQLDAPGMPG